MRRFLERLQYRAAPLLKGPPLDWPEQKKALVADVSDQVAPFGLHHQSSMDWTEQESNLMGFRKVFRIHDAGSMRPLTVNWGYSIDFVPHVEGTRLRWHRTFASARRDLWYVPSNDMPRAHRAFGKATFEASVPHMISDGLQRARAFWDRQHNLDDLAKLLENAVWQIGQFPGHNKGYVARRSALSWPFVLARIGHQDAESCLAGTLSNLELYDEVHQIVREKFATVAGA